MLAFLSVCLDSCGCACFSQCLYGLLCLRFSVFVWTLELAFLSVCMRSCACACVSQCFYGDSCACVSQCLYGLLCLRLRFSVFVYTLLLAFLSVCIDSNLVLAFLSVCMDSCAFACLRINQLLCCLLSQSKAQPLGKFEPSKWPPTELSFR